jgi:ABC-type transport system involved in multi-copper enzyme maturation permease subunit
MKQLLKKEWREQFKVALIGLVIFTIVLITAVRTGLSPLRTLFQGYGNTIAAAGLQPLVSSSLLVQSAFFCALFGGLLGWLQIQAERHPDLRAFLLHRPMERTTILWSKLLAGLGLYAVGAGLPMAGLVIYVIIPGHVPAPFEWAMVLPLVNIFLLGLLFLVAGMLTGARQARWYGSRIFGLGPAVLTACLMFSVHENWHALVSLALVGALLMVTLWSSFQTGGTYSNQCRSGKVALSLTCVATAYILSGLVIAVLDSLLSTNPPYRYSNYQITKDGQVYQVTQGGGVPAEITDLNGRLLLDKSTGKPVKLADFNRRYPVVFSTGVNFKHSDPNAEYYGLNRNISYFIPWRMSDKVLWYWTRDGRLVGFDGITRLQVGSLGPDGPVVAGAALQRRFDPPETYYYNYFETFNPPRVLASGNTLYLVDVDHQTATPFFTATNQDGIGGFSVNNNALVSEEVLVVTREAIHLIDTKGRTLLSVPYEPAVPAYSQISVYELAGTNYAVEFLPDYQLNIKLGGKLPDQIAWVDKNGGLTRREKLPLLPEYNSDDFVNNCCLLIVSPAPRLGGELVSAHHDHEKYHFDKWDGLSFIPAIFSVLVGWVWGRRYHFTGREQAAWAGFNFVFGIPGLLAFFCVQEWPARETCPHCRKQRLVDREQCEHCGGEFAPPVRNGTEIFESAGAVETTPA